MEVGKLRKHLEISQSNNNRTNKDYFNLKNTVQRIQTEKNEIAMSVNDESKSCLTLLANENCNWKLQGKKEFN